MANVMTFFKSPERTYCLLALAALAVGLLVYLFDRSPAHVYALTRVAWWISSRDARLGTLGGSLPDLVHVYAFILLTAATAPKRNTALPICAFWLVLDALFELGQHSTVAPRIAAAVPAWFQHVPFLDNTASYFLHGTFDYADLLAIVVGTVFAYGSIAFVQKHLGSPRP